MSSSEQVFPYQWNFVYQVLWPPTFISIVELVVACKLIVVFKEWEDFRYSVPWRHTPPVWLPWYTRYQCLIVCESGR